MTVSRIGSSKIGSPSKKVTVGDIVGGHVPLVRSIGDPITIQTIYDTYRWYPGFKAIIALGVEVIWSNGLKDGDNSTPILPDRTIDLKDETGYCDMYGYAVAVIDGTKKPPTIDAWHPEVDGIGFTFSEFSPFGDPLEIRIKMKVAETAYDLQPRYIPAYPCELDDRGERILTKPIPGKF